MKQVKNTIFCLACMLLLSCELLLAVNTYADEGGLYVQKHVCLLFDDSGSMTSEMGDGSKNLKWTYASYAAQAFAALLNDTDTLTVYYMNEGPQGIDLSGDRQNAVRQILDSTSSVGGWTNIGNVQNSLDVLRREGLKADDEMNESDSLGGQQYWLVLTTDGAFNRDDNKNMIPEDIADELTKILDAYSSLHMVYIGIGTSSTSLGAYDFSEMPKLTQYSNFTPLYVTSQEEIVSVMQALSSQITGRYDVTQEAVPTDNTITIDVDNTQSLRTIAVFAQDTDAVLTDVATEDGTSLVIDRPAQITYPKNVEYDNLEGAKGGYIALIRTADDKKIPSGRITLTFSEDFDTDRLSLMYEPAIYLELKVEYQKTDGSWVPAVEGVQLNTECPIRADYVVCEEGTDQEVNVTERFGSADASVTCNGEIVGRNNVFYLEEGTSVITADLSLMGGNFFLTNSRILTAVSIKAADYEVTSSGPISLYEHELEDNTDYFIDFEVLFRGETADDAALDRLTLITSDDSGNKLGCTVARMGGGVLRLLPDQYNASPGAYSAELLFEDRALAAESITIEEDFTYIAESENDLLLMEDELVQNEKSVAFSVMVHRNSGDTPISEEEAKQFYIQARSLSDNELTGTTGYQEGKVMFIPAGIADAGEYSVNLLYEDSILASSSVKIQALVPENFEVESSGPVTISESLIEDNSAICIDFTITRNGTLVEEEFLGRFMVVTDGEKGILGGTTKIQEEGLIRFIPNGSGAEPGVYKAKLLFDAQTVFEETVTIEQDDYFTAAADNKLRIGDNQQDENKEKITFSVTYHSSTEERPVTEEEAAVFRIEADAGGAPMNGITAFEGDGIISFQPSGSHEVGLYKVRLFNEDQLLAESTIDIYEHEREYRIETYESDDKVMQRFHMDQNEAYIAFAVYEDEELCSNDRLKELLEEGIELTASASPGMIILETEVTEVKDYPVIKCTPKAKETGKIGHVWQNVKASYGALKNGEFPIRAVVTQGKGAEAEGSLIVEDEIFWRWFYRILPIVIFLILLMIFMFIYSNLRMLRLKPGLLVYSSIKLSANGENYYVQSIEKKEIRGGIFFIFVPSSQKLSFHGMSFFAAKGTFGRNNRGLLRYRYPTCELKKKGKEMAVFFSDANQTVVENVTNVGTQFAAFQFNRTISRVPVVHNYGEPEDMVTVTVPMQNNGYIVKKHFSTDNFGNRKTDLMDFWIYIEGF